MAAPPKNFNIGIIIGSTRVVRIGPQVATFLQNIIARTGDDESRARTTTKIIDIKDFNLPIFNEPGLAARIAKTEDYKYEHTRAWSRHISSFDAFIFVTPERNYGIPAELKNAIDYLFHEWKGKPALIVSYGGNGGVTCAEQLELVIHGAISMRVTDRMVHMKFGSKETVGKAVNGENLGLDANSSDTTWAEHREPFADIFWEDLVKRKLIAAESTQI